MNFIPYHYHSLEPRRSNPERAKEIAIGRNRRKAAYRRAQEARAEYLKDPVAAERIIKVIGAAKRDAEKGNYDSFLCKMRDSFEQWGRLTEKQEAAVDKVFESRRVRAKKRGDENAELGANSGFVGEVGSRIEFEAAIQRVFSFQGFEGECFGNVMLDGDKNVIVYFGKKLGEAGEDVKFRATVKRHEERDGVKQTVVNRPFAL